ncbi:MAG: preprotein translocase subunit SecA, partial [Chloroflexi bacterium]|nr:preprotein translocase subunit SecA [Chloroflexota bacterium]
MSILSKVFGDYNEKELKKLWPIVKEVNAFEDDIQQLSDEQLRAKTNEFRERLDDGETLEDILPEAFAVVREISQRRLGMRPFDVQILGGVVLHQGKISEMKTGEGKTLVATLPIYLNALAGKGVHLITVNDYLAKRDAQWMGAVYDALGLTIGILQHDSGYIYDRTANLDNDSLRHLTPVERREVYAADITYGTNNEFGFDFLRDNMATDFERAVQRQEIPQSYAIVDEVDSILIDEARTPLIISGPAEETEEIYRTFGRIVPRMSPEQDLIVDLKHKSVGLTEEGVEKVEKALGIKNLYDPENFRLTRFLDAALKAQFLYEREHQYVVKDGEVVIVDEFTGRLMTGRRWSDGLHQAVEAKEGVKIQRESVTYATITLQNYFRMYKKLAGMTGTAWTERDEFHQIYGLDVLVIPTHMPMVRADRQDIIFKGLSGKFRAVVEEIEDAHGDGRPMLVGTVAIETSELLSDALKRTSTCNLEDCAEYHQVCPLKEPAVLNAKQHEREAHIIAMAGVPGAVTIATNMAGRGTDIVLGGNPERMAGEIARKQGIDLLTAAEDVSGPIREQARKKWQDEHDRVVAAGGLHIIGTERHESRRIDNQLRGRCARQGDRGSSRFFLSLEDDLMKMFAGKTTLTVLSKLGMKEGDAIEHPMLTKSVGRAQRKVEERNFLIRKNILEYDEPMDVQRGFFYGLRQDILEGRAVKDLIFQFIDDSVEDAVYTFLDRNYVSNCIAEWVHEKLNVAIDADRFRGKDREDLHLLIRRDATEEAGNIIRVTIGEYMSPDMDPEGWDLKGLADWGNANFDAGLKVSQLREMSVDEVIKQLDEAAAKRIAEADLAPLDQYLVPAYAENELAKWAANKFASEVKAEAFVGLEDPADAVEKLMADARAAYARRELTYPIDFALEMTSVGMQHDPHHAIEQFCVWVRSKYELQWDPQSLPSTDPIQLRQLLIAEAEKWDESRIAERADRALVAGSSPEKLDEWFATNCNTHLTDEEQKRAVDDPKTVAEEKIASVLRAELTQFERWVLLQIVDQAWKDHLYAMDQVKEAIGFRSFSQRDPRIEFKREAGQLFENMQKSIREKV